MKKIVATMLILTMFSLLSISSITKAEEPSDFGASSALTKTSYTLNEMLTYAIQDEYLARAEYTKIMNVYGVQRPFSNIKMSEENHISMLTPLFDKYRLTIPVDTAASHVIVPDSLLMAYQIGVQAEIDNIEMYNAFLKQDLPDDIKSVFIKLRDASYNHLNAFENKVVQAEGVTSGCSGYRGGR